MPLPPVRLVPDTATYRSKKGLTWYLHQGVTRTGKPRYFVAKTPGPGALAALPDGFEFCESLNGVVSVRRVAKVAPASLEALSIVERELARHSHLRRWRAELRGAVVLVHEPISGGWDPAMGEALGISEGAWLKAVTPRWQPVLRFTPSVDDSTFVAERRQFRGEGGWLHLAADSLTRLVARLVPRLGTDRFFDFD